MDNIQAIYTYSLTTKSGKKWCAKLLAEAEQWAAEQGSNKNVYTFQMRQLKVTRWRYTNTIHFLIGHSHKYKIVHFFGPTP